MSNKLTNTLQIDPRAGLLIVFLFAFTGLTVNKPLSSHVLVFFCALYAISVRAYKACIIYTLIYVIISSAMYFIAMIQNTAVILMIVSLSYITQKFIIMLMALAFLKKATSMPYLISAMQVLKFPNVFAIPFIVSLRYLPTIKEDYRCLKDSLKIRGISTSGIQFFIHPIRTLELLIVPILFRSVRAAEELSASALLRGIEEFKQRTNLYPLKFKRTDYVYTASAIIVAVAVYFLQFWRF
ncbi:energy-coupling factor transporter transmembrane component T family protein [Treponema pedis]|uniref:energy-coupling factor transporter transmembrane component T family protein n=1 Tax=Treponema pedis TaxID=409322 RepID=UPI0004156158|nr:energy-coupling factor transporter transmembrane component T [Treponema pedis]